MAAVFETLKAIRPNSEHDRDFEPQKLCANFVKIDFSVRSLTRSHKRTFLSLSLSKRMTLTILRCYIGGLLCIQYSTYNANAVMVLDIYSRWRGSRAAVVVTGVTAANGL